MPANGIHDHDGEAVTADFGIINLLKDSRDAARERFGVGETGVEVAAGDLEFKVVEEIGNEPDKRVVLESSAQFCGECASSAVKVIRIAISREEEV